MFGGLSVYLLHMSNPPMVTAQQCCMTAVYGSVTVKRNVVPTHTPFSGRHSFSSPGRDGISVKVYRSSYQKQKKSAPALSPPKTRNFRYECMYCAVMNFKPHSCQVPSAAPSPQVTIKNFDELFPNARFDLEEFADVMGCTHSDDMMKDQLLYAVNRG